MLLCFVAINMNAQTLKGKVTDENHQPLSFANIVLLNEKDSVFIEGTITNEDGCFVLNTIVANGGGYLLKISSVGFDPRSVPCKLPSDIGEITLKASSTVLDEVVVKGNIPVTRMKNGSMITNVQGSVLANYGSANDVLAKVPSVMKREDGFEVFGKGVPVIYINNRKMRDASELEQLHSADIKSVEVINNPGSAYDASAKAVIRIQTIKKKGDGLGGNVRTDYLQSETSSWLGQIDATYRHKGLDIFGTFKYDDKHLKGTSNSDISAYADTIWSQKNVYDKKIRTRAIQATMGFNYDFNSNHSIGARYILGNVLKSKITADYRSKILADDQPYDFLNTSRLENKDDDPMHQLNVYYLGKIKKMEIHLDLDYFGSGYRQNVFTKEVSQEQASRDVNSVNTVENDLYAAKLAFNHPLWNGVLSFGAEYTNTDRHDDYVNTEGYVPDSYSQIKEMSVAGFTEYSRNIGIGNIAAGVRYEYIAFNYYENFIRKEDESRRYGDWFPDFSFDTRIGKVQAQISYTAKIKRPSYRQLSNNVKYINRFTWQTGNPTLKPTTLHDITLSGMWKFIQASVSYQINKNDIIYWGEQIAGNSSTTLISYINKHTLPQLSAMVSAMPRIGVWNPQFGIGLNKQWLTLQCNGENVKFNKPIWMGQFNNTFMFQNGFMLRADFFYQSKGHSQNRYTNNDMLVFDVSLAKAFFNKALVVELKGSDLFYNFNNNTITQLSQSEVWERGKNNTRNVTLSLRYRFNQSKSKYKGVGAGKEMKARM